MLMHKLSFEFRCRPCQGWPQISLAIDDQLLCEHEFSRVQESLTVEFAAGTGPRTFTLMRHGKTQHNMILDGAGNIVEDQILEIISVKINGSRIPDYIFDHHSRFEFNDQLHPGSRYFSPNGLWSFDFQDPIVTWILDEKIKHEAQYNNDYIYPWSYKFGPGTAQDILAKIQSTKQKVNTLDLP